jgi:flagellar basal-body rod protein FlgG
MRCLHTAATGMLAQELNVQVIANNIANMNTTGFKRQRANFQDTLYEQISRVGSQSTEQGNILPVGIELGSGVKTVGTPRMMSQGTLLPTGNTFDLAIQGEGLFKVLMPDGTFSYTRDGSFQMDAQGRVVTPQGYLVQPGITVPANAGSIMINVQGQISGIVPGSTTPTTYGQFNLTRFVNKAGLQAIGDNLFVETPASGPPQDGIASIDGYGNLQQGSLEQSNVDSVTEITNLITAQRAYEMNSKVITAADQMLQTASQLMR